MTDNTRKIAPEGGSVERSSTVDHVKLEQFDWRNHPGMGYLWAAVFEQLREKPASSGQSGRAA
jgi:hypothetical protein